MKKFFISAMAMLLAGHAIAVPISQIDVGDGYYLSLAFENELVKVVRIDRPRNLVKIRYQNGYTEWVSPGRLLSYEDSYTEDASTAIAAGVIGFALLICMADPQSCE